MTIFDANLTIGLLMVFFGGEGLIRGAASPAKRSRISEVVIGLTVVGFGTSMPELPTSILAKTPSQSDVAIGNDILDCAYLFILY